MITLNNNNYVKRTKIGTLTDILIDGYYKKNKTSVFIYNLQNTLKYAIRLCDGMVCKASKLDNGKTWYQHHLSNDDFKGYVNHEELSLLRRL